MNKERKKLFQLFRVTFNVYVNVSMQLSQALFLAGTVHEPEYIFSVNPNTF